MKIILLIFAFLSSFCCFFHKAFAKDVKTSTCVFQAPKPVIDLKNKYLKKYNVRTTETVVGESGETNDGVYFEVSRGGCEHFGETIEFEFQNESHKTLDKKYWLKKIAQTLRALLKGNEVKAAALISKAEAIEKLASDKRTYVYGDTIKVESDTFEINVDETGKNKVKATVEITAGF